jgi:serine/threonine protein phosphatase PrpC
MMDDTESMQPPKFESTQIFDLGRKRQDQTDLCVQFPELGIHCLIDDHGSQFQGAPASQLLADVLQKAFTSDSLASASSLSDYTAALRHALGVAHFRLRQESEFLAQEPKSCSFLGLILDPKDSEKALCLHAGSCRLYRLREIRLGEFRLDLLSGDHVDPTSREFESQLRTAVQGPSAPPILTQCIGKGEELTLEETSVEVRSADLLLLCSDGLSGMFPDHLIARVLARRQNRSLESLANALISEANAAGGKDNISVILLGSNAPFGLPLSVPSEAEMATPAEPATIAPEPAEEEEQTPKLAPLPGRQEQPFPAAPVERTLDDLSEESATPRRRVFLPLMILLAMVSLSSWLIWGGKTKPSDSDSQMAAIAPSPEAADLPILPALSTEISQNPTEPVAPPGTTTPTENLTKTESTILPSVAAAAREPAVAPPIEAKPIEAKPIEAKPIEAKPIEAKPIEAKPIEAKPIEAKPIEAKPIEAKPVEAKPVEVKPIEVKPTVIAPAATETPVLAPPVVQPPSPSTPSTPNEARVELAKVVPPAAPTQTIPTRSLPTPPPAPSPAPRATPPTPIDRNQSSDRANMPRERSRMEQLLLDYEILLVRSGVIPPSDPQLRTAEARQVTPLGLEKASREEQRELLNEVRRLERDLEEARALDPIRRRQLRTLRERLGGRRS